MQNVHRDSTSAWRALCEAGGLEVDGRDEDLGAQLKIQLDPNAPDLDVAIAAATTDVFLQALFRTVQPFVTMFGEVLAFFKQAGARAGQSQLRISVADEHVDFQHFEDFLAHWNRIRTEIEVPALDQKHAFILNTVRNELGLAHRWKAQAGPFSLTGGADIDAWLADEAAGRYPPFPESLQPDRLPPGLSDIARVLSAAVSIIRDHGWTRGEMQRTHRTRSYQSVEDDALHPWTISQSETDFWLRSHVVHLAELMRAPEEERAAVSDRLVRVLAPFPRRRLSADVDIETLERLLSFPIWKKRHEFYGVWIATRIVAALEDHDVAFETNNDELKFAFRETTIARIASARPRLVLVTERKTPLANPVSPRRSSNVQPDFGLWTDGPSPECRLIIEVKHYKKRSRRNFRDALIDYAAAHPRAKVLLVNYGPVGVPFNDLPWALRDRCLMLGPMTPETVETLSTFQECIRDRVGAPARPSSTNKERVALDISGSMSSIFSSADFDDLLATWMAENRIIALIDREVRHYIKADDFTAWLSNHALGGGTALAAPVGELFVHDESVLVVTDAEGLASLESLNPTIIPTDEISGTALKLARVVRPPV